MWFLLFTGVWFWILTVAIILLIVLEVAKERAFLTGFTIVMYLMVIHLFGDASLFSTIGKHPALVYAGVPGFFLAGAFWALAKWWFFVKRKALEFRQRRMKYLERRGVVGATLDTPMPKEMVESFGTVPVKPLAHKNKGKIITWMVYWPFSMVWTLLEEPWRLIYEALSRIFQKVADKVWGDLS